MEAGYSVLFLTLEALMTRLTKALNENRLERSLQQLIYPKVLIIDEMGYLPLSRIEASLFFRLVARRYERASLIVTSNKSFLDWGEIFNDPVLATAVLDRLLHYSTTLNIKGESYRLKEKRKAGLLGRSSLEPEAEIRTDQGLALFQPLISGRPRLSFSLFYHCQGEKQEQRTPDYRSVLCPGNGTGAALELVSTSALSSAPVPLLYTL